MSGFNDRPFVAGTVVGLRSFRVARRRLQSVTREFLWTAGEQVAECQPIDGYARPHPSIAGANCGCGFYAYFGARNDYNERWVPSRYGVQHVTGIIEGYGTVTIGHLGFRAEKARIIALVQPDLDITEILAEFPDVPVYPTVEEALVAHPTTKPEDVGIDPADYSAPHMNFVPLPNRFRYAQGGFIPGGPVPMVPHRIGPVIPAAQIARSFESLDSLRKTMKAAADSFAHLVDDVAKSEASDPVAAKRKTTEARAQQRQQAGLTGSGGFDKRGRRR